MVALAQSGAIERMMQSADRNLRPEVAKAILDWHFDENDQRRVEELSAKARAGTLSSDEVRELDWYLLLGDFLSIVQSKARVALHRSSSVL